MARAYAVRSKKDFQRLVKMLRKEQELTQAQLAQKSGLSLWSVVRMENPKYTDDLQFGTVRAILDGLGWQLAAMPRPEEH